MSALSGLTLSCTGKSLVNADGDTVFIADRRGEMQALLKMAAEHAAMLSAIKRLISCPALNEDGNSEEDRAAIIQAEDAIEGVS